MPSILDAPDFPCRLGSPFSSEVFELQLDARVREALHAAGIATADYDPETIEPYLEDPGDERDPRLAFWWVDVRLGTVEAFRRTIHGKDETLEQTVLSLHADRSGDEDFNGIRLDGARNGERPRLWSAGLTSTFEGVVRGICEGELPRSFAGLRDELPPFDAESMLREGERGCRSGSARRRTGRSRT